VNGAFVVDASVAVGWVVRSQASDGVLGLLESVVAGQPALVPALWTFEVANSLIILLRRRVIQEDQYERARHDLADLGMIVDEEGTRLALEEISRVARTYSLSVYDASYLELALRRRLPLASRDAALNKAAKAAGVRTLL